MKAVVGQPAAPAPSARAGSRVDILTRLEAICARRGLGRLARRLGDLVTFVATDLQQIEAELDAMPRHPRLVGKTGWHLLEHGGKRLRPLCVALASRLGDGFGTSALDLGVAVELIHNATLLHDDVVDVGESRRGAPTARAVYGNAASIFAGDWLLVEALRRVERTGIPGLMVEVLSTIEQMIWAESLQLENRGRLSTARATWLEVVEGKTASVFRWGMTAGARAGGLSGTAVDAVGEYGLQLGIAFQAVDDLLDLTGDAEVTGKALFADLGEGKMTYPLILALERDPGLQPILEGVLASPGTVVTDEQARGIVESLRAVRAVEDCLAFARESSRLAVEALENVPRGRARRALETVAETLVDRDV